MPPSNLFQLSPDYVNTTTTPSSAEDSSSGVSEAQEQELSQALHSLHTHDSQGAGSSGTATISLGGGSQGWRESGATCQACGIGIGSPGFTSAAEQRAHFKTDWHRYNVKRRLAKQPAVSEEQFAALVEGSDSEVSSISGSSSESDAGDAGGGSSGRGGAQGKGAPPRVMFKAQDGQLYCVWKCLVERDHVRGHAEPLTAEQHLGELRRLRGGTGVFVVLLLRGGHVAAAVFRARAAGTTQQPQAQLLQEAAAAQPAAAAGQPGTSEAPAKAAAQRHTADIFEVVAHKTFHRYVVRAKAGGRQSAKDATGKYARSAGAALRRYNEAALDKDVHDLLASWKPHLDAASLIFVQAPASNARTVFGEAVLEDNTRGTSLAAAGAGSSRGLINPADPRVRRIPFVTQRPTFTEARRVIGLLLSVFEPSSATLAAQQAAEEAAKAGEEQKAQKRALRKQKKQAQAQAQAAVAAGGDGAAGAAEVGGEAAAQARQVQETPLHTAARQGQAHEVARLLSEGANPCLRDSRGRTAYAMAADKDTRDAFRRAMGLAPEQWDWVAAGVPSALTDELQEAQAAKKAEKRARQKARDKEKKAQTEEEKQAEAAASKAAMVDEIAQAAAEAAALAAKLNAGAKGKGAGGKQVGGGGKAGAGGRGSGGAGQPAPLSPEELAKRREMMAQAAEARARALQQATNAQRLY